MDLEAERLIDGEQCETAPRQWRRSAGFLVAAAGLVGLAGAAAAAALREAPGERLDLGALAAKDQRVEIAPSDAACSTSSENCMWTGCCKVTGHKCFWKSPGVKAMCNKTCTEGLQGFQCGIVSVPSMPVTRDAGHTSLYCISVLTQNTGTTKPSTEKELLTLQRKHNVSIFACEAQHVFSDLTSVHLGDNFYTVIVEDPDHEFHQLKREQTGTWVNWGMFVQVWAKVRDMSTFNAYDWTIKVDPDAVFLASRMRGWLLDKPETEHGIYYESCKDAQIGFFGNLEVMSHEATAVLTANLDECHRLYAPCANEGCDWKWGPWGEDVFAQRCMDRYHVEKVQAWDVTTDGACKADRPEGQKNNKTWAVADCSTVATPAIQPFKKPQEWFRCLGQITKQKYDLTTHTSTATKGANLLATPT